MNVIVQLTFEIRNGRDDEFRRALDELLDDDRKAGFSVAVRVMNRVLPQAANDGLINRLIGSTSRVDLVPTHRVLVELTYFHVQDYQRANDDRDRGRRWQEAFALGANAPATLSGVQILQPVEMRRLRAVAS